jgi:hypothetical protein
MSDEVVALILSGNLRLSLSIFLPVVAEAVS